MSSRFSIAALVAVLAPFVVACGGAGDPDGADPLAPPGTGGAEVARGGGPSGERAAKVAEGSTGKTSGQPDTIINLPGEPAPTPANVKLPHRGVNLSGAEFGTALPGKEGVDYVFPTNASVDYYVSKGMNTFRIGFLWERAQQKAYGELAAPYLAKLEALTVYATDKGATVILEPHNFARYYGVNVGSTKVPNAAFADFWRRMAERFQANPRVVFNLVNEPNDIASGQWVGAANAAIAAIRAAGASNVIHAPGNAWTGAHSWNQTWYGTSNAVAMLGIVDPGDNTVFEVHQYLDATSGGKNGSCVSATIGSERLKPFIDWLRQHGKRGFVGELAGGNNDTCNAAVKDMMAAMMDAADVLDGWLWWGAGPWWGDYVFSLEPKGGDAPQMALLLPFLSAGR